MHICENLNSDLKCNLSYIVTWTAFPNSQATLPGPTDMRHSLEL